MRWDKEARKEYPGAECNGRDPGGHPKIQLRRASEVAPEKVTWVWDRRIPAGKVSIWDGDPGQGKSVVSVNVAAYISSGRSFPDGAPCEVGNVLICNVEDGEADTTVPRLKANGADLERVLMFSTVPDGKDGERYLVDWT